MKCPLFQEYWVRAEDHHMDDYEVTRECGSDCPWWDEDLECCSVVSLRITFKWIGESLELIKDALQRLGQTVSIK